MTTSIVSTVTPTASSVGTTVAPAAEAFSMYRASLTTSRNRDTYGLSVASPLSTVAVHHPAQIGIFVVAWIFIVKERWEWCPIGRTGGSLLVTRFDRSLCSQPPTPHDSCQRCTSLLNIYPILSSEKVFPVLAPRSSGLKLDIGLVVNHSRQW